MSTSSLPFSVPSSKSIDSVEALGLFSEFHSEGNIEIELILLYYITKGHLKYLHCF